MTVATLPKPIIKLDGDLSDWVASERIDYGDMAGYSLYAQVQGDYFDFAFSAPLQIGAGTTFWFNTDLNAATGFEVFTWAVGAEYSVTINSDSTATLYTYDAAGAILAQSSVQIAYSTDHQTVEFAVATADIGNPGAINTYYGVNDGVVYGPSDFTTQPYVAYADNGVTRTDPSMRIGIVYSDTTAANYFSATAYSDLIMAAENQAVQAGIPFDLLTEADLTDLSKLVNYDALVFPAFTNVQSTDVSAITNTLLQATKQFGLGLITAGDFMTNDQNGAPLSGDPYANMKIFFDATRLTGGNSGDVTINSSDTNQTVFANTAPGALIQSYSGVGWTAYQSVSGTGQTIATETVAGETQTYAAALATQTGGKNVLFSSAGVMADSNLLGQAIDYVAKASGVSVSLDMTRFNGLFATRMDMDQSQFPLDVSPVDDNGNPLPGIYDTLIPILQQWNTAIQFHRILLRQHRRQSDRHRPVTTDWAKSLTYYHAIEALGGEIGTHSYTHLISPPTTTFTAHTVGNTPAGSIQVTLDPLPSFYGITVGMVVSGLNIGANATLPRCGGESGAVVNTTVTAVSGNTITLSFVPGGYGSAEQRRARRHPGRHTLTFTVPAENTNFLQTGTGTVTSSTGHPFTYDYEFNQAKLLLEQQLGHPIYGAAVPGAAETYATAQNILPYYQSVAQQYDTRIHRLCHRWLDRRRFRLSQRDRLHEPDQPGRRLYRAKYDLRLHRDPIPGQDHGAGRGRLDWRSSATRGQRGWPAHRRVADPRLRRRGVEHHHRLDHRLALYHADVHRLHRAGLQRRLRVRDARGPCLPRAKAHVNTFVTSTVSGNVINVSVASAHARRLRPRCRRPGHPGHRERLATGTPMTATACSSRRPGATSPSPSAPPRTMSRTSPPCRCGATCSRSPATASTSASPWWAKARSSSTSRHKGTGRRPSPGRRLPVMWEICWISR